MPAVHIGPVPSHRRLFRYQEIEQVNSPLDPFEDVLSWIGGLRSKAYTGEILAQVHGIDGPENEESSAAVSALAEVSVHFLEQALSGPQELSYLPTYYAMLNLAKAAIIA